MGKKKTKVAYLLGVPSVVIIYDTNLLLHIVHQPSTILEVEQERTTSSESPAASSLASYFTETAGGSTIIMTSGM